MSQTQSKAFESELRKSILRFGIEGLTEKQILQLVKHYEMLCKWNQRFNLTRITKPQDAATLNYAESLYGARFIGEAKTMLDIGTGAGFPAFPIAITRPELDVIALEANQKKSLFLTEAKCELQLANLTVKTSRLEDIDCGGYDLLTCRALDQAEAMLPSIISGLTDRQRLMLYCVQDLLNRLTSHFLMGFKVEINQIPESEGRLIVIFSSGRS
ncbi:MAG TPA: 16S rRNA (guanine(527)-N(7))-methyltransferase RsmG [Blastocatellia bacterium]|nr:16S rRNA (guanine(527)-N(7))-methyltransferase RsmG [Blastocatellia bacterium]